MLKNIFKMFEPTEAQFTPAAIGRLKWASIISLLFAPLSVIVFLTDKNSFDGPSKKILVSIMALTGLAFIYCCGARPLNRAWTPDKYLDESEISRKRQSASFSFYWTIGLAMIIGLIWMTWNYVGLSKPGFMSDPHFGLGLVAILVSWAFSLQGYKLSRILMPLSDNDERIAITSGDKKYWAKYLVWVALAMIITIVIGALDRSHDRQAMERALKECGQGQVKSVTTKGLFQAQITCSTGDSIPISN